MPYYKFTNFDIGKSILENLQVRFTQPLAFNDPFDSAPNIQINLNDNILETFIDQILNDKDLFSTVKEKTLSEGLKSIPSKYKKFLPERLFWSFFTYFVKKNYKSFKELIFKSLNPLQGSVN